MRTKRDVNEKRFDIGDNYMENIKKKFKPISDDGHWKIRNGFQNNTFPESTTEFH